MTKEGDSPVSESPRQPSGILSSTGHVKPGVNPCRPRHKAKYSTTNPKLLDTYRQSYSDFEQFYRNDGLTLSKSMLLNCAMDGLWMAKSIGVQNHSEEEINQLLEEIISSSEKTN